MHVAGKMVLFSGVINYPGKTGPHPSPSSGTRPGEAAAARELLDLGQAVPLQNCLSSVLNNKKGYHLIFFATWRSICCPSGGMTDPLGRLLRVNPISLGLAVAGWAGPSLEGMSLQGLPSLGL